MRLEVTSDVASDVTSLDGPFYSLSPLPRFLRAWFFVIQWLNEAALPFYDVDEVAQHQILEDVHPVRHDVPDDVEERQQGQGGDAFCMETP